jgi:hypothetical protein
MTLPKLPSKPSPEQSERYVSNIVEMYGLATPEQITAGLDWYPAAHRIAEEFGDTRRGAGIIAALSANKGWSDNVRLARLAFAGEFRGHFADALDKCRAIHAGQDPSAVLPLALKTGQFFLCIADPADPEAVVVDRHAHDVAAGMKYGNADRGLDAAGRYGSIADAYRIAAKSLGMAPSELQAITWTVVVEMARNSRSLRGIEGWGMDGT